MAVPAAVLGRVRSRSDEVGLAVEDLAESLTRIRQLHDQSMSATSRAHEATERVSHETASVAVSAGQMSVVTEQVARSASEATAVTAEAAEVTAQVRQSVDRLNASTQQIDNVVRLVTGIANQTRLLALNATIEAARAGAAGTGFAVVAEEVKNLAAQSGEATTTINQQLAALAQNSIDVAGSVERIDEVLCRVEALQQTIASAVDEQSAAITEITRSADEASRAVEALGVSVRTSRDSTQSSGEAIERSTSWLDRLGTASQAQREDISAFGEVVEAHPVRAALAAHAAWKMRLRQAVESGELAAGMVISEVARNDACAFGRWLIDERHDSDDAERLSRVSGLHTRFHYEAAAVLTAVMTEGRDHARALLTGAESYGGVAAALSEELIQWAHHVEAQSART